MTMSKDIVSLVGDIASEDPSTAVVGVCFFGVVIDGLAMVQAA